MRHIYIDIHYEVADALELQDRDKLLEVLMQFESNIRNRIILRPANGTVVGSGNEFTITRTKRNNPPRSKYTDYITERHTFKLLGEEHFIGIPAEVRELAKRIRRVVEAAQRSERLNALLDGPVQLILSNSP